MSFCHSADPVCQNLPVRTVQRVGFTGHKNYQKLGEPKAAAKYFTQLIIRDSRTPVSHPPTEPKSKWPTKKHNGPSVLFIWLGSFLIDSDWESCTDNYCIVGAGDKVIVLKMHGIEQIDDNIPIDVSNPRAELSKHGIPATEIDALLSP